MRTDLPYLWRSPRKRGAKAHHYWFYRREGQRVRITSEVGEGLAPVDAGFLSACERIHSAFGRDEPQTQEMRPGSPHHIATTYLKSPDYAQLSEKTNTDYWRYLDRLREQFGHLPVRTMTKEFVRALRDKHADKPTTANCQIAVLRVVLNFASEQPSKFALPAQWQNPANRPKKLKTGPGHRPWEDWEIDAFRSRWPTDTVERVAFELLLNTGQRGSDVIKMTRRDLFNGEISVCQQRTGERVTIPASRTLLAVLSPWLEANQHLLMITTETGRPFTIYRFAHVMHAAYRAAGLPDDFTNHGGRHTAAATLKEIGCDWETTASITGHRTAEMVRLYTRLRTHNQYPMMAAMWMAAR